WVTGGSSRVATYPRLPTGHYRFVASATIGDTGDEASSASVAFEVLPQWWQTWWFRILLVGAGLAAFGFGARTWSNRRLRRKLEALERQTAIERERTRIARNIHDDLGASLTRISFLAQNAQHEAPQAAAHFEKIYASATEITRAMDEIVCAVNAKFDDLESLAY